MRMAELGEITSNGFNKAAELQVIQNALKIGAKFHYPNDAETEQFKKVGQKAYIDAMAQSMGKAWTDKLLSSIEKAEAEIAREYDSRIR